MIDKIRVYIIKNWDYMDYIFVFRCAATVFGFFRVILCNPELETNQFVHIRICA